MCGWGQAGPHVGPAKADFCQRKRGGEEGGREKGEREREKET